MFLLYVFGVFVISLFGLQCQPQTREQVLECYSWGDPHIQTWRPKNGDQIHKRDCYLNGHHMLVSNSIVDFKVHVHNKLVNEINLKVHDVKTNKLLFHFHLTNSNKMTDNYQIEKQGVTMTVTTVGALSTYDINYSAANFKTIIRENGNCPTACYYNVYVWQSQALVDESAGICAQRDAGCSLRAVQTDEVEWEPVRSGSLRQLITNEQAESICNQYIDAFFTKTRRAPYQRDAHVNSTIASVLAGCIDDVVLTGQVEMAEGSIDVLMMDELTRGATSIDAIQTAVQSGIEAASFLLDDAVKMAKVGV